MNECNSPFIENSPVLWAPETHNALASAGEYEHISTVFPMARPDMGLLRRVEHGINPEGDADAEKVADGSFRAVCAL